jgi:uncharacterized protein
MFKTPLPKLLPRLLDPRKFAQQGISLQGFVPLVELPRITEALQESGGEIHVDLAFGLSEEKSKMVTGHAQANLSLICQRCLNPVSMLVESHISLGIVWDEEHAKALPEYLEPWIVGEGGADLYDMIEEEMLLSLPTVAYHEDACVDSALFTSGKPVEVKQEKNPFQVLEQLKGSPK